MTRRPSSLLLFFVLIAPFGGYPSAGTGVDYTPAMLPAFATETNRPDLPHYDMAITVDPAARRLNGHLDMHFPNTMGVTLQDVVLRLYPNFPRDMGGDGGDVAADVANARVQGVAVAANYEAVRTAVRLRLPVAAQAGADVAVVLDWQATVKPWRGTDDTLPLPSYYPQLAVWDGSWRTDVTHFPDHVYATSSLYHVNVTVPVGWSVAATGSVINTASTNDRTTSEIVTGPVREWAFAIGRFAEAQAANEGTAITVFHRRGDGLDVVAQRIALHAAAALNTYNRRYGPYPFRNLQFHLMAAGRGEDIGVEFPGLIFILLNDAYTANTRFVVAHEVAHQWFYGMLGDDIYNEPWLDEAFAQYSPLLVEEQWAGRDAAESVYQVQILHLARRATLPGGLSITTYGTWSRYYAAVYGVGARFLYTLRQTIGDRAFFSGMQEYVRDHKYGITHTADFRAAMEHSSGQNLAPLFRTWLGRQ
jgi:hypothetical protein